MGNVLVVLKGDGTVIDYLPFHRNLQVDEAHIVPNLTEIVQVSAAERYSLALRKDGTVWAWGENELGQLGKIGSTKPMMLNGRHCTD